MCIARHRGLFFQPPPPPLQKGAILTVGAASQAFLPAALAAHEFLFVTLDVAASDGPADPWSTVLDDFVAWVRTSQLTLMCSAIVFTYGASMSASFVPRSSYICSNTMDQPRGIVLLQWLGVAVDTTIILLLWRVLSWLRTTKSRLRTLGVLLMIASSASGVLGLATYALQDSSGVDGSSLSWLDSLFVFDILSTGLVCAICLVAATLWVCDSAPLDPVAIATFIGGIGSAFQSVLLTGTYQQPSIWRPLIAMYVTMAGFMVFTYARGMRTVAFVGRFLLIFLMACLFLAAAIIGFRRGEPRSGRHPVDELVYNNRIGTDRWLHHATVSTTLKTAVDEYRERHQGRDPPANFDKWFEFARQRDSLVIDKFDQIAKDLLPFWAMNPQKIRDSLELVKTFPDVGVITIVKGRASHNRPADAMHRAILDHTVDLISSFSEHLPEMSIAINLNEQPRILVPHDQVRRHVEAATKPGLRLLSRRADVPEGTDNATLHKRSEPETARRDTIEDFRRLQMLACPQGSKARVGAKWNVRDLCSSCTQPHSRGGVFVQDWEKSLDPCHQPDLFNLHDFYLTPHSLDVSRDLLPLFSRSKTDSFSDILLPLIRPGVSEAEDTKGFDDKIDALYWREEPPTESVTDRSLHGGQRQRLIYHVNKAPASARMPMLLGQGEGKDTKYAYEKVRAVGANQLMPMRIAFTPPATCEDAVCRQMQAEFHFHERPEQQTALDHRFVLLADTAAGPSPDVAATLRSASVPFLSTVFREWHTERLRAWTHFVPLDPRYHDLQSVLAYFVGLADSRRELAPRLEDARWIAEQGRKWADRALRRADMEIYLFRLLLEWGRLVQDDRDKIGFTLT